MTDKEYIEAKDLDDFRNEIMDRFLSLCDYNDYNKLTLLRISETIDEIYGKYVAKPLSVLTNADRIRAMSDEELLQVLDMFADDNLFDLICNNPKRTTVCGPKCVKCISEWLKQTAEEE